jgi:hypothetical protein
MRRSSDNMSYYGDSHRYVKIKVEGLVTLERRKMMPFGATHVRMKETGVTVGTIKEEVILRRL